MKDPAVSNRFVIASLGSIGRRHLSNLRELRPDASIAVLRRRATADLDPDYLQLTTIEDALAFGPAAAIIAGPAPTHVTLARRFVEQGVPVLIEKPLSHDLSGLAELAKAVERSGVPVMVGYNLRFNPSLAAMRAAALEGVVGTIHSARAEVGQYLPSWRPGTDYRKSVSARRELGGGVLLELSHELDYIYWLFGMPDRITCLGGRLSDLQIDVEDCCELTLEYSSPARIVSVHLDFLQLPPVRNCTLIGTGGTLRWDAMHDRYSVSPASADVEARIIELPMTDRNQTYLAELSAFLAALETGQEVPIPLQHSIDVMRIIAAARRSMDTGRAIVPQALENVP